MKKKLNPDFVLWANFAKYSLSSIGQPNALKRERMDSSG